MALKVQLIIIYTRRKNFVSFLEYLDFYVFHESAKFKICDVIMNITAY